MTDSFDFLNYCKETIHQLRPGIIDAMASELASIRNRKGRLFILGVGGSAATASHAANDFRKLCGLEAYAPTDNVSELTARTNDEGWETVFEEYLKISNLRAEDGILIISVGGGDLEKNVSACLIKALDLAKSVSATTLGIVGRDGGHTAKVADLCVIIPVVSEDFVTPLAESFHGVICHCLASHPALKAKAAKWESLK